MQLKSNLEKAYQTVEICREYTIPVLLNPSPADPQLDPHRIKSVNFLVPNESELQLLTGIPVNNIDQVRTAAASLAESGFERVIVTLGS